MKLKLLNNEHYITMNNKI